MKRDTLRQPLIVTAVVLFFFLLMLSVSIANPAASALGALGLLLMAVVRAIQFSVALAVGIIICIAFLFAVFFGAMVLASPAAAARMFREFRQSLTALLLPGQEWARRLLGQCKTAAQERQVCAFAPVRDELRGELEDIRSQLKTTRSILNLKIEQLSGRIDELEKTAAQMADSGSVAALSEEVRGNAAALEGIQAALDGMKSCVEENAGRLAELSPEKTLGDLPGRLSGVEEQLSPLAKEIAGMQEELAAVREKADRVLSNSAAAETTAAVRPESAQASKNRRKKA